MAYSSPKYQHSDYQAFWYKDFLSYWQSCLKSISLIQEGTKLPTERFVEEAEKVLKVVYPNGLKSKFNCGDKHCPICNENAEPF